jgi:hypothetical protein
MIPAGLKNKMKPEKSKEICDLIDTQSRSELAGKMALFAAAEAAVASPLALARAALRWAAAVCFSWRVGWFM